jgi:hypothetical protein
MRLTDRIARTGGTTWKLDAIAQALESESWEASPDESDQEERRVYLGSWQGNSPSGKHYMPWATGNLDACESCKGTGAHATGRKRLRKKYRIHGRLWEALVRKRFPRGRTIGRRFMALHQKHGAQSCPSCGGMGSREAYRDQTWREYWEAQFDQAGFAWSEYDGDLFAMQSRYREE